MATGLHPTHLLIGNEWIAPSGTERVSVVSPSTEEVIGSVPVADDRDVDLAVVAARRAMRDGPWPHLSVAERVAALTRVVDEMEKVTDELIDLQIDEMGGVRRFISAITVRTRGFLERFAADAAQVELASVRDGLVGPVLVLREPIGVVAGIVPWNGPIAGAVSKLFPSLLMGCPMVLKTSPDSPLSATLMAEAVHRAELPPGTVSILSGGGQTGASLIAHPEVNKVTFTGSTAVGAEIAAAAGSMLKRITLELGGKSAAMVLGGSLDDYVPHLLGASLTNAGQNCVATTRILVDAAHHDELVERLVAAVADMKVGDPHDPDVEIGPVAGAHHRERIERYIASGVAQGATVAVGGGRPGHLPRGFYVEPTVFTDVKNGMDIAQDEIFGPVLSVIRCSGEDEAIAIANDSRFGLGGAIYTDDAAHAVAVARRLQTGTCAVNGGPPNGGGGPFGGWKQSGIGRERGPEGMSAFLETKSLAFAPTVPREHVVELAHQIQPSQQVTYQR